MHDNIQRSMIDPVLPKAEDREHWERVYSTKQESEVSWHQDEPELSVDLVCAFGRPKDRVIDIGGGSSVLAGRLLAKGFCECAVLDISETALRRASERIGSAAAAQIRWIVSDVTNAPADLGEFDVWHDRAVFHFLTHPEDRKRYIDLARRTVPVGGHLIVGTFALNGPEKCSGLATERYDGNKLAAVLGSGFALTREVQQTHMTPWSMPQPFTYAVFDRVADSTQGESLKRLG